MMPKSLIYDAMLSTFRLTCASDSHTRVFMNGQEKVLTVKKIDGRVIIPVKFAKLLGLDKSHIVRVNQGNRQLSIDAAMEVVALFQAHGVNVHITEILPRLKKLKPYLCPEK
jgi:hypothetical protein